MKCAFCESKDIQSRVIVRNELAFAFPTNIPITPGHVLVCPKRCVATFDELTNEEIISIMNLRKQLRESLKKVFGAKGFNYAWNEGGVAGQAVRHIHLHIVPRKEGDSGITDYEPRKFLYRPGSRETSPDTELNQVVALIMAGLK
ncbi:MAG TPA: HIT domain-containing protein [Candidatus Paceibacterota bacterium]